MCHLKVAREKLNMPTNQPYGTQTAAAAAIRQGRLAGQAGLGLSWTKIRKSLVPAIHPRFAQSYTSLAL